MKQPNNQPTMSTTVQAKFESATASDLAPIDTYVGFFTANVDGKDVFTVRTIDLVKPAHPSMLVEIFQEIGSEMGLDFPGLKTVIRGVKSGRSIAFVNNSDNVEDLVDFASKAFNFSNTGDAVRQAKRVRSYRKGFGN